MSNYKIVLILAAFIMVISHLIAQPSLPEMQSIQKNSISANILGTGSYLGISYERLLGERISAELGIGLIGFGGGMSIYFKRAVPGKLNFYSGIKASTHAIVDGEHKTIVYTPFGLTFFARGPINFGMDIGPAYRIHHSPGYMPTPEELAKYPFNDFGIFGNLKMGIRF